MSSVCRMVRHHLMAPAAPCLRHLPATTTSWVSVRSLSDAVGGRVVDPPATPGRLQGTLQHQQALPKMPVPPLDETLGRYLDRVLPLLDTDTDRDRTRAAVQRFQDSDGPRLHQRLLDYDTGKDNYIADFYQEMFSGATCSNYSLNPNFVLFPRAECSTAPESAAFLVASCLQHLSTVRDGTHPATVTKKGPIDMRQIPWIHSSARIARQGPIDDLVSYLDTSQHIVVLCRGLAFKLPVLDAEGNIMASQALLAKRFQDILNTAAAAEDPSRSAVGALTTSSRDVWSAARARLEAASSTNMSSLTAIDEAILVVALDDATGLSPEDMELNVLYGLPGTVENRWMDKWNIIVCADGQAGMNWEHTILDGHTMMEFFAPVGAGFDAGASVEEKPDEVVVAPLELSVDPQTEQDIAAAMATSLELSRNVGVACLEFQDFGGNFAKSSKCSPDGFAQASMILTFFQLFGRTPSTYESVLAKAFRHGRVTVARNNSEAIAREISRWWNLESNQEREESFRAIVADVNRICLEAAGAGDVDRPLLAYRCLADKPAEELDIFADDAWAKFSSLDLCTSHCGRNPIRFFGYEPPNSHGFSIGYCVEPNYMQFSINHADQAQADQFKTALAETLRAVQKALQKEGQA